MSFKIHKWLVFLSACYVMVVPVGFCYSLGALFVPFMEVFQATRAEASLVQSVGVAIGASTAFLHGLLMFKYGMVKTGLVSSCVASLGLGLSFFATSIPFLIVTIGILMAVGSICMYIVSSAAVGQHFSGRQSLILLSVLNACNGLGGMMFPFLLAVLNETYGLRGTLLIVAGLVMNTIPCAFLRSEPQAAIKGPAENEMSNKDNKEDEPLTGEEPKNGNSELHQQDHSENEPFRNEQDVTFTESVKDLCKNRTFVGFIAGMAFSYPPIIVLTTFIVDTFQDFDISKENAYLGLLLLNAFSIIGRLLPGVILLSKYVKTMMTPIAASLVTSACMAGFILANLLYIKFVFLSLIGVCYGIFASCFNVTTMDIVGSSRFGIAIGFVFSFNGVATITAGPICGFIRDTTGSYLAVFLAASGAQLLAVIMFAIAHRFLTSKNDKIV